MEGDRETSTGLGLKKAKNKFQTHLLKQSRRSPYFIGSGNSGFFIFSNQSDVETSLKFYDTRIAQEAANRDALRFLASVADFATTEPGKDAAA